jgi:triacylglycerol lipase
MVAPSAPRLATLGRALIRAVGPGLVLLAVTAAGAQMNAVPPEVGRGVQEIGRGIDPPRTAQLYAPLQEKQPYAGLVVTRDVKYGSADRHLLDVFADERAAGPRRPVLMFVHGGAFVSGDRRAPPGSPFYDNIVVWAARNGFIGVNLTYRLAPAHPWPAGTEDVAAAVRWVREHAAGRGGDPERVFLMGHSAGATHVATYVAHPRFHGAGGPGIAGAILLSGLFDLSAVSPDPPIRAYYGEDTARWAERGSLAGLVQTRVPLLVVVAELDPPMFEDQSARLGRALCDAGRCPRAVTLPGHSHMSEVYAFNSADTLLPRAILDFVKAAR